MRVGQEKVTASGDFRHSVDSTSISDPRVRNGPDDPSYLFVASGPRDRCLDLVHGRDGWSCGFVSCAHWLNWRTGLALGAALEAAADVLYDQEREQKDEQGDGVPAAQRRADALGLLGAAVPTLAVVATQIPLAELFKVTAAAIFWDRVSGLGDPDPPTSIWINPESPVR